MNNKPSIFEVRPGMYNVKYPDDKPFISFWVWNGLDPTRGTFIVGKRELKPYHVLVDAPPNGSTNNRENRIDGFAAILYMDGNGNESTWN